jgi:FkbM family methyltransferase
VTATYTLRESGVAVVLRHHSGDVMGLDIVFAQQEYELPPRFEEILATTEPLRVVDLGANIGLFGAWLLGRFPQAEIVAFEADPSNAAVHRLTIQANNLSDRWRLVEGFAGTRMGTTRFVPGLFGASHLAEGREGIEVSEVDVLPDLRDADLVKIDIEGAEWPIVADPRFRELRARAVILEYHPRGCPGDNPRALAQQALRESGFELVEAAEKPTFGAGVLWGWRS